MLRIIHLTLFQIQAKLELINEQDYMFKLGSFNCQTSSRCSRAI